MEIYRGLLAGTEGKIVGSIILIVLVSVLRSIFIRIVNKRIKDLRARYGWRQSGNYVFLVIGAILIKVPNSLVLTQPLANGICQFFKHVENWSPCGQPIKQDGLNKYDGHTFTVYKYDPADSTSLSELEPATLTI
jgi:hypothetical protein